MSLKQELEIYIAAVACYDREDYDSALEAFERLADTSSKIRFNIGLIHATLGEHEYAIQHFDAAVKMDRYLAVAYFQQGVSNFLMGDFLAAKVNFGDALLYMRGNTVIDYTQLGLKFKLYSCEVMFNHGLCSIYRKDISSGLENLVRASREKQISDHEVIDEALKNNGQGYTVFSVPVGTLYRPDEGKVRNAAVRDYLGKAKLIAATDASDIGTGFVGYERKLSTTASSPLPSSRASTSGRPASYRQDGSVGQTIDHESELEFARLDAALQRKASTSSVRENFPLPTRSRTVKRLSPSLPPTPPLGSRDNSRKNSSASSTSSKTASIRSSSSRSSISESFPELRKLARSQSALTRPTQVTKLGLSRNKTAGRSDVSDNVFAKSYAMSSQSRTVASIMSGNSEALGSGSASKQKPLPVQPRSGRSIAEEYIDLLNDYCNESESSDSEEEPPPIDRIKVKVCGFEEARVITIRPFSQFSELRTRLMDKFGWAELPKLCVKDEDDEFVLLQDQEDLNNCCEEAINLARQQKRVFARLELHIKLRQVQ